MVINTSPNFNNCPYSLASNIVSKLKLTGDVVEFGTFTGRTAMSFAEQFPNKTVFTIDHFQGLEKSKKSNVDEWYEGAFALGREEYKSIPNVPKTIEDLYRKLSPYKNIKIIESDVHKLTEPKDYGIKQVAYCHIDVDIYEPTVSALEFLTKCEWEKVFIRFDDWHGGEAKFDEHERLAFSEWIEKYHYNFDIFFGGSEGGGLIVR
jgi:hypothetical protein